MASTRKTNKKASMAANAIAKAEKKAAQRAKTAAPVKAVIAEEAPVVANTAPAPTHYESAMMSLKELKFELAQLEALSYQDIQDEIAETIELEAGFDEGQPSMVPFLTAHKTINNRLTQMQMQYRGNGTLPAPADELDVVLQDAFEQVGKMEKPFDIAAIGTAAVNTQEYKLQKSIDALMDLAEMPQWNEENMVKFLENYQELREHPEAKQALVVALRKHEISNGIEDAQFSKLVAEGDQVLDAYVGIRDTIDYATPEMYSDLGNEMAQSLVDDSFDWQELAELAEEERLALEAELSMEQDLEEELESEADLEAEMEPESVAVAVIAKTEEPKQAKELQAALQSLLDETPAEEVAISDNSITNKNVAQILTDLMAFGELTPELKAKADSKTSKANLQATRQYIKRLMVDMNHPDVQKNSQYRAKKGEFNKYDAAKVKPKDLNKFYKGMIKAIENGADMNHEHLALKGKEVVTAIDPEAFIDAHVVETKVNERQEPKKTLGAKIVTMVTDSKDFLANNVKKIMVGAAATVVLGLGLFTNSTSNSNKAVKQQDNKADKSNINVTMATPAAMSSDKTVSYENAVKSVAPETKADVAPVAAVKKHHKPKAAKPVALAQEEAVVIAAVDSSANTVAVANETISNTNQLGPMSEDSKDLILMHLEAIPAVEMKLPEVTVLPVQAFKDNADTISTHSEKKRTVVGRFLHNMGEMFKESFRGRTSLQQEQELQALRAQNPGLR